MGKILTLQFMEPVDEIREKYKPGSIVKLNGKDYKVLKVQEPLPVTKVIFVDMKYEWKTVRTMN